MVIEQPSSRRRRRLPKPTSAPPGSAAKVEVLRQRYLARQSLWHPRDARRDPDGEAARLSLAIFQARGDES